ncbi:contact-dependent growth inhibition system immunity protein [Nocardioides sp. LS1]|uniref:contact-dependent growth inhibition system immunity protein n=1 Tax=Nocardioides sp. LS1 TaxID=1027620 RepID=UPI000F61C188|nr:contact-dependent growth inhibition system immunity protein [Nocardioides sp. LS1]GCD91450.1 hypothetical protein NLS1_34560 [Nocardioides sp. LS1]
MNTPALRKLVDGYFHQDWYAVYGDESLVVQDFVDGEPDLAPLLAEEIREVVTTLTGDVDIRDYLLGLGSCYTVAPDTTYREWLTEVAKRIEEYLAHS